MDELTIGDKKYISSKRAAVLTGYAKDYVGQLCREGHVEAKMVGRSWYVLESSIKEHRFGAPEKESSIQKEESKAVAFESALPRTWEAPIYTSEVVPKIPELVVQNVQAPTTEGIPHIYKEESLNEMQAAWKEWFSEKQELRLESPEVIDAREEDARHEPEEHIEEEVPVIVPKVQEIRPEPRRVVVDEIKPIVPKIPAPKVNFETSTAYRPYKAQGRTNMVFIALLIALAGFVVAVAVVGSGLSGSYMIENPVTDYLGGTRTISK